MAGTGDTGGIEPVRAERLGVLAAAWPSPGRGGAAGQTPPGLSSPTSGCQSEKAQPCSKLLALVLTGCVGPASGPGAGEVSQMSEPQPHLGRVAERHAAQLSGSESGFIT